MQDDIDITIYEPGDYIIIDFDDIVDLSFLSDDNPEHMENEVIRLTNVERRKYGLNPLEKNDELQRSALLHTLDMAENHFISHTGSDGSSLEVRIKRLEYRQFKTVGENLAMGYMDPETVVQGWMNSPGHRENILMPEFNQIGVAFIKADVPTKNGTGFLKGGYWTQHFGVKFRNALFRL